MKNSDMPAAPCSCPDNGAREELLLALKGTGDLTVPEIKDMANKMSRHGGLTKREHFAATMNHDPKDFSFPDTDAFARFIGREIDTEDYEDLVSAVLQGEAKIRRMRADALLAELELTQ